MSTFERVRNKAAMESDLLRLRLRHRRTLAPISDGTGPVALVVSMTHFVYQLKLESMVAKALELKGLAPVFVVPTGAPLARRYLHAFGMRRFVEIDSYLDESAEHEAAREAARIVSETRTMRDVVRLEYRGAPLGRNVLSTISRILHRGSIDFGEPEARIALEDTVRVAARSTIAAEAILDDLDPAVVVFLERNYAAEAPVSDLALQRGLNVIQFVSALQDDGLVFKRYAPETRRLHPRSLSDKSWERVKAMPWTTELDAELDAEFVHRYDGSQALVQRNQEWTQETTADEIRKTLDLDRTKPTVVIFSHILWDANMFYGDDLFDDQEEWLVETVRAACANDNANWIVKLHPANVWKLRRDGSGGELSDLVAIREHVGELPQHVRLLRPDTPIPTRPLFDVVDVGITIRGSIGFELPCFGVPVLTAGTGFYAGRGFTIDSATRDEYLQRLSSIEETPRLGRSEVELARRHAYALFRMRPLRFTSFRSTIRPLERMGHPLDHDLELLVRSREELFAADDLRRLGDWAVDSSDLDYLADVPGTEAEAAPLRSTQ